MKIIICITGNFDLLSDKLKQDLKKVFEAEPAATEPRIYQGELYSPLWLSVRAANALA